MTLTKEVPLQIYIPESLKYRLDLFALKNNLTLKEATEKILDENLPESDQE